MKQGVVSKGEGKSTVAMIAGLDLGRQMGNRQAFALIAGRCSAADVETLRRIRDEKSYRELGCTWDEFCTAHLHVARRSVDRAIGYLEEFGPAFFHITQLAHISAPEYRAIAGSVSEQGVNVEGRTIALLPENSQQLSAAVAGLLKAAEPKKAGAAPPSFDSVLQRCQGIAETLQAMRSNLDAGQKIGLADAIARLRKAAAGLGVLIIT